MTLSTLEEEFLGVPSEKPNKGSSSGIAEEIQEQGSLRSLSPEFKAGFVIGQRVNLERSEIPHFRAINVIAALETAGMGGIWCYEPDIPDRIEELLSCNLLVLVRGAWTGQLDRLMERAETAGIPIVFDIDDYCFMRLDPEHLASARRYSPEEIEDYNDAADRYFKTLSRCRYFTAPTTPLAGQGERLGLKSYVLRNTLNKLWLEVSEQIVAQRQYRRPKEVTIGYFPGSCTHQRDFRQALQAILRVMDTFGEVRFLVSELLDMTDFPELRHFHSRLEIMPRVNWRDLAHEIARVDINIAPLELDAFCQSKSELKYFQAGALTIPSIVTPTVPYQEAIEHRVNGFFAAEESEWYDLLSTLVTDEGLRKDVGRNARRRVLARYTPTNLLNQAITAYEDILGDSCALALRPLPTVPGA